MTDAELEELDVVTLAEVMLEADQGGYSPFAWHGIVRPLISTIRELRAKEAARDRVVEAAQRWKATQALSLADKPQEDIRREQAAAKLRLYHALAALEEQS